jgi:hypothetical protein
MAYLNLLASITEPDVQRLRHDPATVVKPSLVLGVSHLLGYWIRIQPLGSLLGRALDGGQPLHPELWHPLRPPGFHPSAVVGELSEAIERAWEECFTREPLPEVNWLAVEIDRLLRVFCHAAAAGACIVSALDPPANRERGSRVRLPWSPRWHA